MPFFRLLAVALLAGLSALGQSCANDRRPLSDESETLPPPQHELVAFISDDMAVLLWTDGSIAYALTDKIQGPRLFVAHVDAGEASELWRRVSQSPMFTLDGPFSVPDGPSAHFIVSLHGAVKCVAWDETVLAGWGAVVSRPDSLAILARDWMEFKILLCHAIGTNLEHVESIRDAPFVSRRLPITDTDDIFRLDCGAWSRSSWGNGVR